MEMMIKAKVFDGSKACITFIRETSMIMRDPYPRAFKSLWLNKTSVGILTVSVWRRTDH